MIHLKPTCDVRRTKKDGTHPIVFRLSLKGQSRDISTGLSCRKQDWDKHNHCVKPKSDDLELLGKRIQDQLLILMEKLRNLENSMPEYITVQEVKDILCDTKKRPLTLKELWLEEVQKLQQAKRYGNASSYRNSLGAIETVAGLEIPFEKVTFNWLVNLETALLNKGLKVNSVAVYFRTLRSVVNKAINYGYMDQGQYPFRRFKIRTKSSRPRVASIEELQNYFAVNLHESHPHFDHWNFGRLIFLLRGINFKDLCLLTNDNIQQGRIVYTRQKTHKMYSVKMLPLVEQLISYYHDPNRKTLFPMLKNHELDTPSKLPARIGQLRKTTNKWLGVIGKELKIKEPLTTYVFRYSHATACKKMGFSKDLISESLGHGYGNAVSSAYLENFDVELIDEMNEKVCKEVMKGV